MTRKWICLLLVLALALLGGCVKKAEPENTLDFGEGAAVSAAPAEAQPETSGEQPQTNTEQPLKSGTGKYELAGSVCYVFPGMLYGAVAYTNTDSTAITLTEASFTFTYAGGSQQNTFQPVTAGHEAVQPGETAWCTLWLPVGDTAGVIENPALTAQLSAARTDKQQQSLGVSEARLIQNYPGFATLSGRLSNPGTQVCDLNLVYAGFYDKDGVFLGAWHFTRNAVLQPGDGAAFVVHLQALPIEGLIERTAQMRFRAFGI
jgi:hypothetical protein